MKLQRHNGFTLIEVLIASVILFSALAITAELYNASSLSATKASEKAHIYQNSPIAVSSIKAKISSLAENRKITEFSDELIINGVKFTWHAQREKFSARTLYLEDIIPPAPKFGLFKVTVQAIYGAQKTTEFTFKVATW